MELHPGQGHRDIQQPGKGFVPEAAERGDRRASVKSTSAKESQGNLTADEKGLGGKLQLLLLACCWDESLNPLAAAFTWGKILKTISLL